MKLGSLFDGSIEWRPIKGYENEYLVSEAGDVWSLRSRRKLSLKRERTGYLRVNLSVDGVSKAFLVHRLVAVAFIPNPSNKPTVNHINENKGDNRAENLEWATMKEQNIHGTRTQRAMANTDWAARTAKMDYKEIAKKHNCLLIVDNTFLSPYFQNPLDLGADIVIHSGTKFLGGHNDTLAGFIVTNREEIRERLRFLIKTTGAGLAPFDSWLILRGIKTLGIRMKRSSENAGKIALWLQKQSIVKEVFYPGLPTHPGYEILKKQARGFGPMLTFYVDTKEHALKILEGVRMIKFAESLGGVETLITYPTTQTHADVPAEVREKNGITECTLRMSVGIEDYEDLINELEEVFRKAGE